MSRQEERVWGRLLGSGTFSHTIFFCLNRQEWVGCKAQAIAVQAPIRIYPKKSKLGMHGEGGRTNSPKVDSASHPPLPDLDGQNPMLKKSKLKPEGRGQ